MSKEVDIPVRFFVYIIESPSDRDIYYGTSEGALLKQAVELNNIPCSLRFVISKEAFTHAITYDMAETIKIFNDRAPVLHISAHGFEDGLLLSNGDQIEWHELKELMAPLREALGGNLLLCMSSCKGLSSCRMAMSLHDDQEPFFAVIGHNGEPTWPDTAVAYATFYHLIAKGHYVISAVNAMCVASGNKEFGIITASEAKKAYIKAIEEYNAESINTTLENQLSTNPPSPLAKKYKQHLRRSEP